jgi:hypothetical protein
MITILGIKMSYETLAFFILFIASEYLGMTKKRRSNSVTQAISMAAAYFSKICTEDDTVRPCQQLRHPYLPKLHIFRYR